MGCRGGEKGVLRGLGGENVWSVLREGWLVRVLYFSGIPSTISFNLDLICNGIVVKCKVSKTVRVKVAILKRQGGEMLQDQPQGRPTVEVTGHKAHGAVPVPGSIVIARVAKVMARMASADIMCVGSKSVREKFSGIIRMVIIPSWLISTSQATYPLILFLVSPLLAKCTSTSLGVVSLSDESFDSSEAKIIAIGRTIILTYCIMRIVREVFVGHQDIRATEIDKVDMHSSFRPGDIVRASILSLGDARAYYLSTAKNELGVVSAESTAGATMVPISWTEMQCPLTGQIEQRKVAKV
ncbi:nucleic acid-binding, OB-fold-like protein [Actinidia rufa]|uniref:Nucleic acid-binding, OB-fold-like protein n=1 Tax=Actinidia rufa TaxID=165716 RepID=A0A7J0GU77_9ERIC|nr:nucleic acid-binding, OB-fold-like protein [Actinidia rufa]